MKSVSFIKSRVAMVLSLALFISVSTSQAAHTDDECAGMSKKSIKQKLQQEICANPEALIYNTAPYQGALDLISHVYSQSYYCVVVAGEDANTSQAEELTAFRDSFKTTIDEIYVDAWQNVGIGAFSENKPKVPAQALGNLCNSLKLQN